jgi:hypothetical protein
MNRALFGVDPLTHDHGGNMTPPQQIATTPRRHRIGLAAMHRDALRLNGTGASSVTAAVAQSASSKANREDRVLRSPSRSWIVSALLTAVLAVLALSPATTLAAGTAGWSVHAVPEPTNFQSSDAAACATIDKQCDRYQLLVLNTGQKPSSGRVTLTDTLPAGITAAGPARVNLGGQGTGEGWNCTPEDANTVMSCELIPREGPHGEIIESVLPGAYAATVDIFINPPSEAMSGTLKNTVTVQGGGLQSATQVQESTIGKPAAFELDEYSLQSGAPGGVLPTQAGAHPWELTTSFQIPSQDAPPKGGLGGNHLFSPARNFKNVAVELPVGVLGDPLTTPRCEESVLREGRCPKDTQVGVFSVLMTADTNGEFESSNNPNNNGCCSDVYNIVPEAGYPAEFGFTYAKTIPILMYANVIHTGTGYRVRVTVPAVSATKEILGSTLTFFGEPNSAALHEGAPEENPGAAFLSGPSDCSAEAEETWKDVTSGEHGTAKGDASRIELTPWGAPEELKTAESSVYPELTGCAGLKFEPKLALAPSPAGGDPASQEGTTEADEPSAYSVSLKIPQTEEFDELSTPDLRDATVTLPAGVSVSPSAATGLVGCQAEGPEGINVGSADIGKGGQDEGDPEATELGEGHAGPGGNNSPYDDGFYHTAAGHCPAASTIGTAEVCTPLLANLANSEGVKVEGEKACEETPGIAPLKGHVYLATPKCGGEGQPECTEASATNGELFGQYIELAGDGVIAKVPGTVAANPQTGQLTSTFAENPQLAFGELKLHFKGGPRAPLANPQTCGSYTTTAVLEPWSHDREHPTEGTPNALSSSAFEVTGCAASMPFAPSFTAGTTSPAAGQFSNFVLSFSRQDREQDLSGLSETMPAGLVGKIAGVPECPEAQANAGTCGAESQLGTTTATAGPGPEPYVETGGKVYFTGPYDGAPFGLSIVVPTKAGPFNLGDEVIRARILVNPETSQTTVVTNPLPQSKDGVPFRLRTVTTEINRPGFIFNPTNCSARTITGTLSGDLPGRVPGSTVGVSAPFQATGCSSLGFHPEFSASTQGNGTRKGNGASLDVKIAYPEPYTSYANVEKVDTSLPLALSSKLTTLQKACTEAQFAANPAGCPSASDVGVAVARTPILKEPLMGPAILVSHANRAFPDLDIVLQGEGVTIVLTGNTDIKGGITYSKFESVPDAPVSSFELNLPEKENSILAAVKNLCDPTKTVTRSRKVTKRVKGKLRKVTVKTTKTEPESLVMPTEITGQNGAKITQQTKIAVTGCKAAKPAKKATKKQAKKKRVTRSTGRAHR